MKCPQCGRYMQKIVNTDMLPKRSYFYMCRHCDYISEIFIENNKPFGDNYPAFPDLDSGLNNWQKEKKQEAIKKLKKEHIKIIKDMKKSLGKLTDNDEAELLIWLWEFGK